MDANMITRTMDNFGSTSTCGQSTRDWMKLSETFYERVVPSISNMDDFEAILSHVWKIEEELLFAESMDFSKKSKEDYEHLKSMGNESFKKKDYVSALKYYNASALHAADSSDYAVVLNNRAATFFHSGNYVKAIADSISSLKEGYPSEKAAKVNERINKSLEKLGISLDEKISLDAVTSALHAYKKEHLNKNVLISGKFPKKRMLKSNLSYDGLTAKADVKISSKVGRYVEAAADIKAGEIVIDEKPLVSVISPEQYGNFCHHCLKEIVVAVPCPQCSLVSFCSVHCRDEATYHKIECTMLHAIQKEIFYKYGLRACRFVTRVTLDDFMKETKHAFDTDTCEATVYKRVLDSERHPELISAESCFRFTWVTLFIIDLLRRVGYFSALVHEPLKLSSELSDEELHVAKCIYRFLHILEYNSASINMLDLNCKDYENVSVGTGIYPSTNNLNHDCNANTTAVFLGDRIILVAVRPIKRGDEITLSYGPTFSRMRASERQEFLKKYGFRCTCECCTIYKDHSVESLATDVPFNGFERFFCPKCHELVKVQQRCTGCKSLLPNQKQMCQIYESFLSRFNKLKLDEDIGYKQTEEIPYLEKLMTFLHGIYGNVSVEGMNALSLYPYMLRYLAAVVTRQDQQRCIL